MARLVIFDDRVRGVELPSRPVLIGRSKKNDIPIRDGLLSRKHCSVVPVGRGYRLVDLKSSNGTYLNGKRIDKMDLTVDDIIEIGQTVMVFLEDGVWNRGEGLANLRNPLKAQELIARLRLKSRGKGGAKIPVEPVGSKPSTLGRRPRRQTRKSSAAFDLDAFPDLAEALEEFIEHRVALLLTRGSAPLRRLIAEVLADVLAAAGRDRSNSAPEELKALIRSGVRSRLARLSAQRGAGASPPGSPSAPASVSGAASQGSPQPAKPRDTEGQGGGTD